MLSEKLNVRTISLSKIECLLSQMKAAGGRATHALPTQMCRGKTIEANKRH